MLLIIISVYPGYDTNSGIHIIRKNLSVINKCTTPCIITSAMIICSDRQLTTTICTVFRHY